MPKTEKKKLKKNKEIKNHLISPKKKPLQIGFLSYSKLKKPTGFYRRIK